MKTTGVLLSLISALFISAGLSGCEGKKDKYPSVSGQVYKEEPKIISNTSEFDLVKKQSFFDDDAYSQVRSVYILKDKQTGKEYIGISGIGISERGSHTSGKSTIQDER